VSQSGVSRNCSKALRVFELEMQKQNGEWEILGDQTFLRLERQVHQLARRLGRRPLRLDGHQALLRELNALKPLGWSCGNLDNTCNQRLSDLTEQRILDAWLGIGAAGEYQLTIQSDFACHQRAQALTDHLSEHLGRAVTIIEAIH